MDDVQIGLLLGQLQQRRQMLVHALIETDYYVAALTRILQESAVQRDFDPVVMRKLAALAQRVQRGEVPS